MITFIFVTALLILAALYISRPLLAPHAGIPKPMTPRERLLSEKAALMARIRDLDYDVETGKIPEAEHQRQREPLLAAAASLLQQLDELDSRLEKKIASRRAASGERRPAVAASNPQARKLADSHTRTRAHAHTRKPADLHTRKLDEEIEAAVARLRRGRTPTPAAGDGQACFCTQCGHAATAEDRFCAACGSKLPDKPATR
jgi:septal ring factor EnvC (AmiA/AmiB activator)